MGSATLSSFFGWFLGVKPGCEKTFLPQRPGGKPICHFHDLKKFSKPQGPWRWPPWYAWIRMGSQVGGPWGGGTGFCCLIQQHKKVWSSVWFSKAASGSSFYDKPRNTDLVLLFTAREAWKRAMMQANSLTVGCHTCRWESVDLPLDRHESYSFTWPMITERRLQILFAVLCPVWFRECTKNGRFLPLFLGCQQKELAKWPFDPFAIQSHVILVDPAMGCCPLRAGCIWWHWRRSA